MKKIKTGSTTINDGIPLFSGSHKRTMNWLDSVTYKIWWLFIEPTFDTELEPRVLKDIST